VVVAALALDRLDDRAGDVVGVGGEVLAGLRERGVLGGPVGLRVALEREAQRGASMRGQSNFGNRATLRGSVLVRLIV
jgi:hypothetical protein